jgi:ABC-type multidrug transport system ATPase subunit
MLEISELVKVYPGPIAALLGIDLSIENGMFGLLGPNGAGKSTLMQIVAGVLEPTSGEVRLDGNEVTSNPTFVRERLGYLPQDFGFYPQLTGRAMLTHLLRLKGAKAPGGEKKLVDELLERVNLSAAAKRKVGGYSGGMRQRLGIAQAVAGNPRILIVDEPTAGLDPEERYRFYRILAELAEDRIVLLSTHIVEDVSVLCPEFAIIHRGRLIARTTPEAARTALANSIFQRDVEPNQLERLQEENTVIQTLLYEGKNRVRIFQPDGGVPAGFEPVDVSLEDAYLAAVQLGGGVLGGGAGAGLSGGEA